MTELERLAVQIKNCRICDKENKMKKTNFLILILVSFLFAQMQTFTIERSYPVSRDDSHNSAKAKAIEEAQIELLQELGVLVEAQQKMRTIASGNKSQQEFTEELRTYTLGRINTVIIDGTEKFDGRAFSATFEMNVDTAALRANLNNIVEQKQQAIADSIAQVNKARADSLAMIRERAELEQEAQRRRLAQQMQADSVRLARETRVSELELAVRTARNLLTQEEKQERPLRIEKDRKERELRAAENERSNAQRAYSNAINSKNADRIIFEQGQLRIAENKFNAVAAEHKTAFDNWRTADNRVQAARRNLAAAENNLARETRIKSISAQTNNNDKQQRNTRYSKKMKGVRKSYLSTGVNMISDFTISTYGLNLEVGTFSTKNPLWFGARFDSGKGNIGVGALVGLGTKGDNFKFVFGLPMGYWYQHTSSEKFSEGYNFFDEKNVVIGKETRLFGGAETKILIGSRRILFEISPKYLLGFCEDYEIVENPFEKHKNYLDSYFYSKFGVKVGLNFIF